MISCDIWGTHFSNAAYGCHFLRQKNLNQRSDLWSEFWVPRHQQNAVKEVWGGSWNLKKGQSIWEDAGDGLFPWPRVPQTSDFGVRLVVFWVFIIQRLKEFGKHWDVNPLLFWTLIYFILLLFFKYFSWAVLGPCCCSRAFSSVGTTLCWNARASHWGGCSSCRTQALWQGDFSNRSSQAKERRLGHCGARTCPVARGIFPDQGSNHCPLHCKADSTTGPPGKPWFTLYRLKVFLASQLQRAVLAGFFGGNLRSCCNHRSHVATVDSLVQKSSLQFPGEVPVYRQPFYLDGRNLFFCFF